MNIPMKLKVNSQINDYEQFCGFKINTTLSGKLSANKFNGRKEYKLAPSIEYTIMPDVVLGYEEWRENLKKELKIIAEKLAEKK